MGSEAVFNCCLAGGWQVLAGSWLLRIYILGSALGRALAAGSVHRQSTIIQGCYAQAAWDAMVVAHATMAWGLPMPPPLAWPQHLLWKRIFLTYGLLTFSEHFRKCLGRVTNLNHYLE
jgi:hypothetical protein